MIYALDARTRHNYLVYGREDIPGTRLDAELNIETDELQNLLTAIQELRGHHDYTPQRQSSGPRRGPHGREETLKQYTIVCGATVHLTAEADRPEEALKVWQRWRSRWDHVRIDNDAVVILGDSSPRVLDSSMKVVHIEKN